MENYYFLAAIISVFLVCLPLQPVYEVLSPLVAFFLSKSDVHFGPSEPALPLPAPVSENQRGPAEPSELNNNTSDQSTQSTQSSGAHI